MIKSLLVPKEFAIEPFAFISHAIPETTELLRTITCSWHKMLDELLLNCLEPDPNVNTAHNNTCFVAIAGYHGNPVYRAVALIPICVSVTWLPKFLICGRFPWEATTPVCKWQKECKTTSSQLRKMKQSPSL
jgi:hypothetical protein